MTIRCINGTSRYVLIPTSAPYPIISSVYGVLTRWSVVAWVFGLATAVLTVSVPVGFLAASGKASFSWEIASVFGTAMGTTVLAGFTAALAFTTSGDVRATWELAQLTREDHAARERPIVVTTGNSWIESDDDGLSGFFRIGIINIGLGPALDVVLEARFATPDDGKRLGPEPSEVWGGIVRVMLPGERYTFRLGVVFPGPTPEWAPYLGAETRATFADRTRRRRYDLNGNEASSAERILWTSYSTLFVGAEQDKD